MSYSPDRRTRQKVALAALEPYSIQENLDDTSLHNRVEDVFTDLQIYLGRIRQNIRPNMPRSPFDQLSEISFIQSNLIALAHEAYISEQKENSNRPINEILYNLEAGPHILTRQYLQTFFLSAFEVSRDHMGFFSSTISGSTEKVATTIRRALYHEGVYRTVHEKMSDSQLIQLLNKSESNDLRQSVIEALPYIISNITDQTAVSYQFLVVEDTSSVNPRVTLAFTDRGESKIIDHLLLDSQDNNYDHVDLTFTWLNLLVQYLLGEY